MGADCHTRGCHSFFGHLAGLMTVFKSAPHVAQSTGKTWLITGSGHVAALAEAEVDILSGQGVWPVSHLLEEGLKEVEGSHHPNSGDPNRSPQARAITTQPLHRASLDWSMTSRYLLHLEQQARGKEVEETARARNDLVCQCFHCNAPATPAPLRPTRSLSGTFTYFLLVLSSEEERQDYSHPNTLDTFKNKQNLSEAASDKIWSPQELLLSSCPVAPAGLHTGGLQP